MSSFFPVVYDDGGRAAAGFKTTARGDCFARAVAIATSLDYREAHDAVERLAARAVVRKSDPDRGVYRVYGRWLLEEELGWVWISPFEIAGSVDVRLNPDECPHDGPRIVVVPRHFVALVDGALRDTWDCSNGGRTLIAGYWRPVRPAA